MIRIRSYTVGGGRSDVKVTQKLGDQDDRPPRRDHGTLVEEAVGSGCRRVPSQVTSGGPGDTVGPQDQQLEGRAGHRPDSGTGSNLLGCVVPGRRCVFLESRQGRGFWGEQFQLNHVDTATAPVTDPSALAAEPPP